MWARARPVLVQMWVRCAHLSAWLRRSLIDTVTIATIPATKAARGLGVVGIAHAMAHSRALPNARRHSRAFTEHKEAQAGFTERKEARDGDRERRRQSPAHQP